MKIRFSHVIFILALIVASCAAYFSVWGLSQLFAGASTAVIIMASALELGKVITTTALHRYWNKIARGLKIYLTVSVGVLMIITSAGIYGFLSNAYQKTANKMELHDGQVGILNDKKILFQKGIDENQKIIDNKNKRVAQLTDIRIKQEDRLDIAKNNKNRDKARGDIQKANDEIQKLTNDVDALAAKNSVLSDSISKYTIKALETESNSDVAGEVGPLKYISELTGQPMANVVNFLILLLIFVFDPLAIALILITNRVFELEKNDGVNDGVNDTHVEESDIAELDMIQPDIEEQIVGSEPIIEPEPIVQPEVVSNKIKLEDIKEIKNRGYSVDVPQPKNNNTIERIGSNKVVKNGDNNKVFFKRN